ncbi:MAG: DUF222 domain-containing protein [Actinomycetes bacterium]
MTSLSSLTIDELADGICLRAGRIAAAEAELLAWIGEFDERGGWGGVGMLSCAQWLSWKIGLSPGAARERVRVARQLRELPVVAAAFGQGLMSWSQVRAITRAARPDDGIDWVDLARSTSGAQMEKLVRGLRRAQSVEEVPEDCERAEWLVRTRKSYDADGNLVMTVYAKAEVAPVVEAAFDLKRAQLERERAAGTATAAEAVSEAEPSGDVPAGTPADETDRDQQPGASAARAVTGDVADVPAGTPVDDAGAAVEPESAGGDVPAGTPRPCCRYHERQAQCLRDHGMRAGTPNRQPAVPKVTDGDALLAMAQATLDTTQAPADTARRNRYRLTAQVDPVSGWARLRDGELLPPTSLTTIMKTLPGRGGTLRLRPVTTADLRRFDLGRTQRQVSANLRELLGTVDGERCRFPGCTRHKKLHGHHVVFWSNGGPTDFDNLVLVCARHHTLIHAQGFRLVLHADRRLDVTTADGVPIVHLPERPWGDPTQLDPTGRITARTITPPRFQPRMDLHYVVSVLARQAS